MKKSEKLQKLEQAIERALQALEELEKALHDGDHRKVGARLYELRHTLLEASRETKEGR